MRFTEDTLHIMAEGEDKVARMRARNDAWLESEQARSRRNRRLGSAIIATEGILLGGGGAGMFLFQNNDLLHNVSIATFAIGALTSLGIGLRVHQSNKRGETFVPFNINNYRGDEITGPSDF